MVERLPAVAVDTWLRPIRFVTRQDSGLHLAVPTETFRSALLNNYAALLSDVVDEIAGTHLDLHVGVEGTADPSPAILPVTHASELEAETVLPVADRTPLDGRRRRNPCRTAEDSQDLRRPGDGRRGRFRITLPRDLPVARQAPALVYAAEDSPSNLRAGSQLSPHNVTAA